jgi:hypothetical protein
MTRQMRSGPHALSAALAAAVAVAEAGAQVRAPYAGPDSATALPLIGAVDQGRRVGVPPLAEHRLPEGYRELRVSLLCGACVPNHFVRLLRPPRGAVQGEAVMFLGDPDAYRSSGDSTREALARSARARTDSIRRTLRCRLEAARGSGHARACRVGRAPAGGWGALWAKMESAGVWSLPDSGVVWPPDGFGEGAPGGTAGAARPACLDLGGRALWLERRDGPRYAAVMVGCLESRWPGPVAAAAGVRDAALLAFH